MKREKEDEGNVRIEGPPRHSRTAASPSPLQCQQHVQVRAVCLQQVKLSSNECRCRRNFGKEGRALTIFPSNWRDQDGSAEVASRWTLCQRHGLQRCDAEQKQGGREELKDGLLTQCSGRASAGYLLCFFQSGGPSSASTRTCRGKHDLIENNQAGSRHQYGTHDRPCRRYKLLRTCCTVLLPVPTALQFGIAAAMPSAASRARPNPFMMPAVTVSATYNRQSHKRDPRRCRGPQRLSLSQQYKKVGSIQL